MLYLKIKDLFENLKKYSSEDMYNDEVEALVSDYIYEISKIIYFHVSDLSMEYTGGLYHDENVVCLTSEILMSIVEANCVSDHPAASIEDIDRFANDLIVSYFDVDNDGDWDEDLEDMYDPESMDTPDGEPAFCRVDLGDVAITIDDLLQGLVYFDSENNRLELIDEDKVS